MSFLELCRKRQSVRRYREERVAREKIERCLEAARLAPSACNSQPWRFIIVDDPELKNQVASATFSRVVPFNRFTIKSPVIVVLVIEPGNISSRFGGLIKDRQFNLLDAGITAEHFCLQATQEGLGTCIIGWFDEKKIKDILDIPSGKRIGLLISLGYPGDRLREKDRKHMEEIRSYNSYTG